MLADVGGLLLQATPSRGGLMAPCCWGETSLKNVVKYWPRPGEIGKLISKSLAISPIVSGEATTVSLEGHPMLHSYYNLDLVNDS